MQVDIFTAAMRAEFVNGYSQADPARPAPWESIATVIDSKARIEHYAWLSPSPGIQPYVGHRRFAKIDVLPYKVENLEYDAAFQVPLRDVEDEQVGGYTLKARQLGEKARLFPGRAVLKTLSFGKSTTCFDGSNFFADSHTIGTGDNLMTFDAASNDGTAHNLIALVHQGPVRPVVWQNRKPFQLRDNAESKESLLQKSVSFWVDGEGAAAFGYWWDAIYVDITDTPTVAEMQTLLGQIEARFRGFTLPRNLGGDEPEFVHEQTDFNTQTCTLVCSTALAHILRQVLNQDIVVASGTAQTNVYKGFANLMVSAYLNE